MALLAKSFADLITYTRASAAGRFNWAGLFEMLAANQPRFDYDPATVTSSTTPATIAKGSVTLAVGRAFSVGDEVQISADASNYMQGVVTAATANSVTVSVVTTVGAGSSSNWTVIVFRGLLMEGQRTNLFLQSENLASSSWTKSGYSVTGGAESIRGDNSAFTLTPTGNGSQPQLYQSVAVSGAAQSVSFTVKSAGAVGAYVQLQGATSINSGCRVVVDLATGVATSISYFGGGFSNGTVRVRSLGKGRWRITLTAATLTTEPVRGLLGPSASPNSVIQVNTGDVLICEMPQFETGGFATSYVPTTTAAATRAKDNATSPLSPWYNQTEGTIYAEATISGAEASGNTSVSLTSGLSISERVIGLQVSTVVRGGCLGSAGQDTALLSVPGFPAPTVGTLYKAAMSFAVNDARAAVNGQLCTPDTNTPQPVPTLMNIGSMANNQSFYGHIRRIRYWPKRLTNSELQALTA